VAKLLGSSPSSIIWAAADTGAGGVSGALVPPFMRSFLTEICLPMSHLFLSRH
jgi:hypothetical protein